jgi:hypothetical protein
LDHLVYCVHDLAASTKAFELASGVAPVFGGYHRTQGTKNALVGLGGDTYLEFLAIDPDNTAIAAPRWMGIDLLGEAKLTRWAIKSTEIEREAAWLENHQSQLGQVSGGERLTPAGGLLRWQLSLPLAEPEVELAPFLIDWSASEQHPAAGLPGEVELIELELFHPDPARLSPLFKRLEIKISIKRADSVRISARFSTPKGILQL